jgi:hypothetical protein
MLFPIVVFAVICAGLIIVGLRGVNSAMKTSQKPGQR